MAHGVLDINWSPDGSKAITAANDNLAILWDMKTFKKIGTLKGHADWVVRCQFSPNGSLAATSSSDRSVKVWDTKTLKEVAFLENEGAVGTPLCFTTDGKFLLSTGVDDNLEFYKVTPAQAAAAVPVKKPVKKRGRG
jgi:WD40 repeat protein